ncbi:hypothetical protein AU468_05650 [Alkalispirochaeta sphaeroplastigenens]|uniref:Multidrug export protein MepA n=1 Tax=Alkalispirochaeta sphaeroplastigenens TaxID=1187066 RepID=A0A2S4JU53_9SPIO|nr:MATE family efflux transporter [Alkalispirochaeta sphaeroplastigenens]POR03042.1 hypothetical protein AU468_05650 [Alkalispirochaeta sphaeroplastigenens]
MRNVFSSRSPVTRQFLRYLVPSVSAMWFFSIYTMIDGIFVGRGVGPLALAAVNTAMPYINTVFAVSLLAAVGSSTMITFAMGRGEWDRCNHYFTLNVVILTVLGVVITGLSLLFLKEIALFLGATPETMQDVKDYLRIIIIFSTFFMVAYSLEVLVKADGFPLYSTVFVVVAAVTNIVLDYLLVIVIPMGVRGAAIATGMSQAVACAGCLVHFLGRRSNLKLVRPRWDWRALQRMFVIGFPEALTELSAAFCIFFFNLTIVRTLGAYGLAAFGVIMYLNNLVLMTMIGINQGMQPLISYYNGREEPWNFRRILSLGNRTALVFALAFLAMAQGAPNFLVSLFLDPRNSEVFALSLRGLRIFSLGFLLCGFNVILAGYFTALKETLRATVICLLRGYLLIALVLLVLPSFLGERGIWLAPVVYEALTLGIALVLLVRYHAAGTTTPARLAPEGTPALEH